MKRMFEKVGIEYGDGRRRAGHRLVCSECGESDGIVAATHGGGSLPPDVVASKFSQKGWTVADRPSHDVCPACNRKKLMNKRQSVVTLAPVATVADKPREMSREDKRLIFGKIDAVYLDETRGYENGWSDKRVAEDLGVPLAWVRGIRASDFGMEGLTAESREVVAAIKKLSEEIDAIEKKVAAAAKDIADVRARFARTERAADDMRKLTVA